MQLGSSSSPPSSSKKLRLPEPSTPLPSAPQPPPPSKKAKGKKSPSDLPSTTIAAEPTTDPQTTPQLAELRRENESLRLQLLATAASKISGGTNPPPNPSTNPPPSQGGQSTLVGVIAALTSVAGPPPPPSMPYWMDSSEKVTPTMSLLDLSKCSSTPTFPPFQLVASCHSFSKAISKQSTR